jgi:hypothetical protein
LANKPETCFDRFAKQMTNAPKIGELRGKSSLIFDFTKADKNEAGKLTTRGFGGSEGPENVIIVTGSDAAAIQQFYKAETEMKLPSILLASVSLLRVEGPFGSVAEVLKEGCKRETAGVKLVSYSITFPTKSPQLQEAQ